MLFATWWIFITVLTAFYTANLTAYMTLSALKIPVQSIEDISRNQMSWLAPAGEKALYEWSDGKTEQTLLPATA